MLFLSWASLVSAIKQNSPPAANKLDYEIKGTCKFDNLYFVEGTAFIDSKNTVLAISEGCPGNSALRLLNVTGLGQPYCTLNTIDV